jgi:outer membrane protein OmpA-like peptidoglycan-associated protein
MRKKYARRVAAVLVCGVALAIAPAGRGAAQERTEVVEPWFFTIDGFVSGPINDLQREQFDLGGGGAIGLHRSFAPWLAFGLRAGGGALSEGVIIPQDPVDRGALEWASLSATMRVRPFGSVLDPDRRASGVWLQVGVGPWLVDGDVVPVFDGGIGYGIPLGPIVLSPMGQITHVIETEGRFGEDNMLIWNGGIEIAFLDHARTVVIEEEVEIAAKPEIERVPVEPAPLPEPLPPAEDIAVPFVNDELVIDERVFFDYGGSDLRPTGVEQLDEVIRRYEESGDGWEALVVSGHSDRRGPDDLNVELSRERAESVRGYLTSHGVPDEVLEIQAWGATRPEIPEAETEYEHQVNRRVQFEIVWREGMRPEGEAPEASPPEPDLVDPAPPARRSVE